MMGESGVERDGGENKEVGKGEGRRTEWTFYFLIVSGPRTETKSRWSCLPGETFPKSLRGIYGSKISSRAQREMWWRAQDTFWVLASPWRWTGEICFFNHLYSFSVLGRAKFGFLRHVFSAPDCCRAWSVWLNILLEQNQIAKVSHYFSLSFFP